jgi:hypothetical protein
MNTAAASAERAVGVRRRPKLLAKSMSRQSHNQRGTCASGAFDAQCSLPTSCGRPPFDHCLEVCERRMFGDEFFNLEWMFHFCSPGSKREY